MAQYNFPQWHRWYLMEQYKCPIMAGSISWHSINALNGTDSTSWHSINSLSGTDGTSRHSMNSLNGTDGTSWHSSALNCDLHWTNRWRRN